MEHQQIYGYRLTHEDGSVGEWSFIDDNTLAFVVQVNAANGALYRFNSRKDESLERWAKTRELRLDTCIFQLNSEESIFYRVSEGK